MLETLELFMVIFPFVIHKNRQDVVCVAFRHVHEHLICKTFNFFIIRRIALCFEFAKALFILNVFLNIYFIQYRSIIDAILNQ